MNKLVDEFIEYERLRGIKNTTNLAYQLNPFFDYINICKIKLKELTFKDAQDFQTYLTTLEDKEGHIHYATLTIKTIMSIVTRLYSYLKDRGIIYTNPFLNIKRIKVEKSLPRNLPHEKKMNEFLKELSQFWKHKTLGERRAYYKVHVMAELMYSTGLRISEVLALKYSDVDFDARLVNVVSGKGDRQRFAYLNDYACMVLKIYCKDMREVINSNKNTDTIFGVVSASTISAVFHRRLKLSGKKYGIINFTTHSFRHSLGFHLLRRGCDMRYIQLILGHEDMNSTVIYTKVEKSDLKTELDNYHPRQEEE
jgi:integrase/recombinase XerD